MGLINKRFKSKKREIEIEEPKILEFAENYFKTHDEEKWNGRQIRNACQTALALAEFRAQGGSHERVEHADAMVKLKVEDLETVSNAYLQFMHYLNEVRGLDADRWAKSMKFRAREVDVLPKGGEKGNDKDKDKGKTEDKKKEGHHETVWTTSPHPNQSVQLETPPPAVEPPARSAAPTPQLPPQPPPTAAPLAAPPAPPARQYGPNLTAASPPGYHPAYYYEQGYAPPSVPVGTGYVPPPADPQRAAQPQAQGWTAEAIAAWYQQQVAQQQAAQQAPPAGQGPPYSMPPPTSTAPAGQWPSYGMPPPTGTAPAGQRPPYGMPPPTDTAPAG